MTPTSSEQYVTRGGITVRRTIESVPVRHAVEPILDGLDERRGVLLTSSYEYPGRYTRWDMGFVDPPLALTARGRRFRVEALNERGRVLLPADRRGARGARRRRGVEHADDVARGRRCARPQGRFAEEERSRQPSVFSRAARARRPVPPRRRAAPRPLRRLRLRPRLPVRADPRCALERPADQRDLVLYLPDELIVVDHRREVAPAPPLRLRGRRPRHRRPAARAAPRAPYVGRAEAPPRRRPRARASTRRSCASRAESFKRGDLFEVVPGPDVLRAVPAPALGALPAAARAQPAPYGFLINLGEAEYLVGASPEMYVRVDGDRVETCPISGTIARGRDPDRRRRPDPARCSTRPRTSRS